MSLDGRPVIDYAMDIAKSLNIPVCATAHTRKKLVESGVEPASNYDLVEIINHLKDPSGPGSGKKAITIW